MAQELETKQETVYKTVVPHVDIFETEDAYHLKVEMPGVDKDNLDVTYENHTVRIIGNTSTIFDGYYTSYQEFAPVQYEREFEIGDGIDKNNIKALIKHGVLDLSLPKNENLKPRKIPVTVA